MTLEDLTTMIVHWVGAVSVVVVTLVIIWNFIEVRLERRNNKQD